MRHYDIYKAGGILISDRRFLVTRSKNSEIFISPGGKVHQGETSRQALIRELAEELCISVNESDLEEFDTFYAPAAGQEEKILRMDVYLVRKWTGDIKPGHEIESYEWIGPDLPPDFKLGSIFEHEVLPRLKQKGLID